MTEDDATIRLPAPRPVGRIGASPATARSSGRHVTLAAAAAAVAAAAAFGAWLWFRAGPDLPPDKPEAPALIRPAPPAPVSRVAPPPGAAAPTEAAPPLASETEILAHRAEAPSMFRLADNPRVFVADLPDLDAQGAAFNRIAALIEKVGQPRDRVLDDDALAAAIAASGDTAATYYYGHNYRGRDLERFFALAARDGIALNAAEQWLREEAARARRLVPAPEDFALISVPGLEPRVDPDMRAAILHHEIGHGHFFTNDGFAAHVARVWREVFTDAERAAFAVFLEREGYDPALEEVMMNEAMAYLIFTPDARFFTPAHAGLTEARAEELRAALRAGAPR